MQDQIYQWALVGAGPAGIAALGQLLDHGIDPQKIAWIDPSFQVGDFGTKWRNVSSNTKVALFIKFLESSKAFNYLQFQHAFKLDTLDPEATCKLADAADPLQWVSNHLKKSVQAVTGWVQHIQMQNGAWQIKVEGQAIKAKNVILAQGALPKTLPLEPHTPLISLETALDPEQISTQVDKDDVVAVFGASHSGIIAIRLLLEAGVKQVINFYRGALRYAVYLDDWTLFDNTGLKGETAKWARQHLDATQPERLQRVWSNNENIQQYLKYCTKAVHAVGFNRRDIPVLGLEHLEYNAKSGIIAPGLFGVGIAFPEETIDPFGNIELSVGLWKFIKYLKRVMPIWLQYPL